MQDGTGNGKFAQELIMEALRDIKADVSETRKCAEGTAAHVAVLQQQVNALQCKTHGAEIAEIRDAVKTRLSWRAMIVAVIPAILAGVLAGARLL